MQRKQPDPDRNNNSNYYQRSSPIKKPKIEETGQDSDQEENNYRASQHYHSRIRREQNKYSHRTWAISPSCTRLHSIEEILEELESIETRSASLYNLLEELGAKKQHLISNLKDLTQTQLQEQLSETLENIQEQLKDPDSNLSDPSKTAAAVDHLQNAISPQDLVQVETPFHTEDQFEIGRVIQTLKNNIVLVRLRSTGKVFGTFGSKVRILDDI